jgi:hypothetical protein
MPRLAGLFTVLVVALLLASVAGASTQSGVPDATALRSAGLRVTWPVKAGTTEVTANSWIDVAVHRVKAGSRRGRAARISLVRVSRTGRPIAVVARQTLRSGLFEVKVPNLLPARYVLTLEVGDRRWNSNLTARIITPLGSHVPEPPKTSAPPPAGPCVPPADPPSVLNATTSIAAASITPGSTFDVTVHNNSDAGCVSTGMGFSLQRQQPDGSWGPEFTPADASAYPAYGVSIPPHQSWTARETMAPSVVPGHYRIVKHVGIWGHPDTLLAEVDVVAPGAVAVKANG